MKARFDKVELRVDPAKYVSWGEPVYQNPADILNYIAKLQGQETNFKNPENGFQPIDIFINDRSFLEIIRETEEPIIAKENLQRDAESQLKAGDYYSLPATLTYLPCRNLLDEPDEFDFLIEPEHLHSNKSTLLGCTCGVLECWFIVAKITLTPTTVTWSNFAQFHFDYEYDLKPFVFEREQYERELLPIIKIDGLNG